MSCCRYCGEEIDFIWTNEKKYRAVDPEPVLVIEGDGRDDFIEDEEATITGRVANKWEETRKLPAAFVPHWRTCNGRVNQNRR